MVEIPEIRLEDAEPFLQLCLRLDEESAVMMLEPGERRTSIQEQCSEISRVLGKTNSTILVAIDPEVVAGYMSPEGGEFRRNSHSAHVVMGVQRRYAGQGVATRLLEALVAWSRSAGLARLELTVIVYNAPALALYRKIGFADEGVQRCSLMVGGEFVDELSMALILDH